VALEGGVPHLSVVIPCWNEQKNIEAGALEEVYAYLSRQAYAWELIVADDGSTDASRDLAEAFVKDRAGCQVITIAHGGKPAAVWAGIQAARGEWVLFTDMDQSTPIQELDKLCPWYEEGYDVVIGSRGLAREGTSALRQLGSAVFLGARQLVLLRDIRDTQCGFKSCRREAALKVFPRLQYFQRAERPKGWRVSAYDVELLHLFQHAGYRIKEVEVQWRNRDLSTTKSQQGELQRYVKESLDMAREVFRVKRNQWRGWYDRSDDSQK